MQPLTDRTVPFCGRPAARASGGGCLEPPQVSQEKTPVASSACSAAPKHWGVGRCQFDNARMLRAWHCHASIAGAKLFAAAEVQFQSVAARANGNASERALPNAGQGMNTFARYAARHFAAANKFRKRAQLIAGQHGKLRCPSGGTLSPRLSPAETCSVPARESAEPSIAQSSATVMPCVSQTGFAATQHAAKRLSANRKARARPRLVKTAANIAAANARGIIAGALTGHAEHGAKNTWPQRQPVPCKLRSARNVNCSTFRMTSSAHAAPCWSETTGSARCATSSAIVST